MTTDYLGIHTTHSPLDCIPLMFAATTENGDLAFPIFDDDSGEEVSNIPCLMTWSRQDAMQCAERFRSLLDAITKIAAHYAPEDDFTAEHPAVAADPALAAAWDTYLRPFAAEGFETDTVCAIGDKLERNESVTGEEESYYDRYCQAIYGECAERLGKHNCAYEVVLHARRTCRLMILNAPRTVIDHEAAMLAAAMALCFHCSKILSGSIL